MMGMGWAIAMVSLLGMGSVESVATGTVARLSWSGIPHGSQSLTQTTQASGVDQLLTRYLAQLKADGIDPTNQGVWIQRGYEPLGSYKGTEPRSAASLTKMGTSLAALEKWGPKHQFETKFWTDGQIQGDRLVGNLIVEGGGDPVFVWEEAIAVAQELNGLGIREVTGDLVLTGVLYGGRFPMNFLPDPQEPNKFGRDHTGTLLTLAWDSSQWTPEVVKAFEVVPDQTQPIVKIAGAVRLLPQVKPTPERATLLLTRRSLPLVQLLKLMNVYSNNAISEQLAAQLGGGPAIARQLAESMEFPAAEIQLMNGSGLGVANKMSPRAAAALVRRLVHHLRYPETGGTAYTLADIFPISGQDIGSIRDRNIPPGSTVKTGTLNAVSALAGLLPTGEEDPLTFAIINSGLPRILRINQDRLLASLQTQRGKPTGLPATVKSTVPEPVLGDRKRNVIPAAASPASE